LKIEPGMKRPCVALSRSGAAGSQGPVERSIALKFVSARLGS
jgi:hypothetical protein